MSSTATVGTVAYLEGRPGWRPEGPIPAMERPCSGWVDRAPIDPIDGVSLAEALRWAEENAEATYLRISLGEGEWLCVRGEPVPGSRHLDPSELPELVRESDEEPSGWAQYEERKRQLEGAWLADLRTQLGFSAEDLARRSGVLIDSIQSFESSPRDSPVTIPELIKVVHVLADLQVPEGPEVKRRFSISAEGPLQIAIQCLYEANPDLRLPPSPAFGSAPPRGELLKVALQRFVPALRHHGFTGRGREFTKSPEEGTCFYVGLQPYKTAPPSAWERKGWMRRELTNRFYVNASVGYSFPDNPERDGSPTAAFMFGCPSLRLEADPPIGLDQEWLLDDPDAAGVELVHQLETNLLPWFDARRVEPVLVAMERPLWFETLHDRLTAVRLACLHGRRELAERLFSWASWDHRARGRPRPDVLAWLKSQYGLE